MCSPSTSRVGVPFSARFHSARPGRHPGGRLVEGLQMSPETPSEPAAAGGFVHAPVMLAEIVEIGRAHV